MPSTKELFQQRKAAKEAIKGRVPIVGVLLALGFFSLFATLAIAFAGKLLIKLFPGVFPVMLVCAGISFVLYLVLAIKYKKAKTSEQERKKTSTKNAIGSLVFIIIFIGLVFLGFWFFLWLSAAYPFTMAVPQPVQGRMVIIIIISLATYFASIPFIMALWYKTAPGVGVKLIVNTFKALNWKRKTKACEIMILETPQEHSFTITFTRAFTALIFSLTIVFSIWHPLMTHIGWMFPSGLGSELYDRPILTMIDSPDFVMYCSSLFFHTVIPVVASFVLFFWALPSTYLLDDAGLVYYKKYTERRQPAELRSVSQWFFSMIKAILGTSALITYVNFISANRAVVVEVFVAVSGEFSGPLAVLAVTAFSIFIFGFPIIGTVLMAFILQLFQDSQFNKLKTHLFQELVDAKIDPRVVQIKFERKDELQERTLIDYTGENFFATRRSRTRYRNYPLLASSLKDMLKK